MVVLRLIVERWLVGKSVRAFRKMRNGGQTLQSPFTTEILTSLVIVAPTAGNKRTFITAMSPGGRGGSFERALFSVHLAFFRRVFHPNVFPAGGRYIFPFNLPIRDPYHAPTLLSDLLKSPNVPSIEGRSGYDVLLCTIVSNRKSTPTVLSYMYKISSSFLSFSISLFYSRTIGVAVEIVATTMGREKEIGIDGVDKVGYYLYASS